MRNQGYGWFDQDMAAATEKTCCSHWPILDWGQRGAACSKNSNQLCDLSLRCLTTCSSLRSSLLEFQQRKKNLARNMRSTVCIGRRIRQLLEALNGVVRRNHLKAVSIGATVFGQQARILTCPVFNRSERLIDWHVQDRDYVHCVS